jgi:hypothetical protein
MTNKLDLLLNREQPAIGLLAKVHQKGETYEQPRSRPSITGKAVTVNRAIQ